MEFYYGTCHSAPDPQACYNSCWQQVTVNYSYAVQSGSDGVVAGYSQRGDWTIWSVGGGEHYEAVGVNHLEMRGHDNMTARFRDVFNRQDPVFNTPTR